MQVSKIVQNKIRDLKLLILDVDGVLTDGRVYVLPDGKELKVFDVKDGRGIKNLIDIGIDVVLISGRESSAVNARAEELGISEVYQNISDKVIIYERLVEKFDLERSETAYVGDDLNDLEILSLVGLSVTVKDGISKLTNMVDLRLENKGGRGAIRELADIICNYKCRS